MLWFRSGKPMAMVPFNPISIEHASRSGPIKAMAVLAKRFSACFLKI
jgi:hypothetical protein